MSSRAHLTFRLVAILALVVAAAWPRSSAHHDRTVALHAAVTEAAHPADAPPRGRVELLSAAVDLEAPADSDR